MRIMVKGFLAVLLLSLLAAGTAFSQRPVSAALEIRKAVLFQYTGIQCAACPDGHRIADSLKAVKPAGSVFVVNIHTGSPATPYAAGEPDYRNPDGAAIAALPNMSPVSYPSAAINRQRFGNSTSLTYLPAQWGGYIDSVQSQTSPYNLAFDATLDVSTGNLFVIIQAYKHQFVPVNHYIETRVYLYEDGVSGPQRGKERYGAMINPVDSSYRHNYMLRKDMSYASSSPASIPYGDIYNQRFYYTVPSQYGGNPVSLGNLRVVAFLTESDGTIITACTGPITLTGFPYAKDAELKPDVYIEKEVCEANLKPLVRIYNNGSQPITTATLQSSLNGGAFQPAGSFSGIIKPATSALVAVPQIGFSPNASNRVAFKITAVNGSPDGNPANDTLSVSNILRTTRLAKGKYQVMRFNQDRYGGETTWKIIEEGTGIVKLAGGPYGTLSNNGIAVHVDSFLATGETCYEIIVNDAGGNGINNGSGSGSYRVTSNGQVIYASNGAYGYRDRALFKTAENLTTLPSSIAGIAEFEQSVSLSPNPSAGETSLYFSLAKGTKLSVQVLDMTGRVVAQLADQNLSAGSHALPISTAGLAGGVYNIRLATGEGVVTRRLVVVK